MDSSGYRRSGGAWALAGALLLAACASQPVEPKSGVLNADAASLIRVADTTRRAGDTAAAIPLYRRAHELDPESAIPLIQLAEALNELGAYSEAATAWAEALRLKPSDPVALSGYGSTLTALNQPHLALDKFRQALALQPIPGSYNGMGVALDMLGRPEEAQASYRDGLDLAPDHVGIANNLGLSLALSGRYADAIEVLERTVTLPGAGARHRQNLALAYGLAGDTERATQIARMDLDEQAVLQNLSYYAVLRDMGDHARKVQAVGSLHARLRSATAR